MSLVGRRLRELLEERGYGAQADLARTLKERPQRINNWATGASEIPIDEVPRLASALGVTICELYGVDEGHVRVIDADQLATGNVNRVIGTVDRHKAELLATLIEEVNQIDADKLRSIAAAVVGVANSVGGTVILGVDAAPSAGERDSREFRVRGLHFLRNYLRNAADMDTDERMELRTIAHEILQRTEEQ